MNHVEMAIPEVRVIKCITYWKHNNDMSAETGRGF